MPILEQYPFIPTEEQLQRLNEKLDKVRDRVMSIAGVNGIGIGLHGIVVYLDDIGSKLQKEIDRKLWYLLQPYPYYTEVIGKVIPYNSDDD